LESKRAELAERSADVLAEIEREAEARRAAVKALVSPATPAEPAKPKGARRSGEALAS
jgi:hypothetical protein